MFAYISPRAEIHYKNKENKKNLINFRVWITYLDFATSCGGDDDDGGGGVSSYS